MQSVEFALFKAVAADYATRVIYRSVLEVDGLGLAVLFTHSAALALVIVEADTKQRKT